MSGKCRFLYNNLITDESMVSVSSLRVGLVTSALKEGTGSGTINTSGDFSGPTDLEYTIEIDGAGTGEVGSSTFKWSDGSGAWNAIGVATSAANVLLNNGVNVNWTAGSGADFVLGDKWYFKAVNLFNPGKMIDLDRDHRYRAATLESPNTITVTFPTDSEIDALVLLDHNLTSSATITLWGDDAATFDSGTAGAPQLSETVTWNADKILHYLTTADRTKRYWQIRIADTLNSDGRIEIGELYLGSYLELSRTYSNGFEHTTETLKETSGIPSGIKRHWLYNTQEVFYLRFDFMPPADVASMRALFSAIASRDTGQLLPFYINLDSADPSEFWLIEVDRLPVYHNVLTYYNMTLDAQEVVASV